MYYTSMIHQNGLIKVSSATYGNKPKPQKTKRIRKEDLINEICLNCKAKKCCGCEKMTLDQMRKKACLTK